MQVDFPYHFDGRERTAECSEEEHIRDLIEQILFTDPGERVNRPEFGAGLRQLLFAPASAEQAATTEFMIRGALQQYLGQRIEVREISAEAREASVHITIAYRILRSDAPGAARFTVGSGP